MTRTFKLTAFVVALFVVIVTMVGLVREATAAEPDGHCPTLSHLQGLKSGFTRYHVSKILGSKGVRTEYRIIPASGSLPETRQEVRSYDNCRGSSWSFVFTWVPHDNWRLNTKVD